MNDSVLWVSFPLECVLTHKGYAFPITQWFDEFGRETSKEDAVRCVAGWEGMCWWNVDLTRHRKKH